MKVGWFLVLLIWAFPIGSLVACPYDLHGFSACSSVAQFARIASFYLVAPGLWLGSSISDSLATNARAGASFTAVVFGIACWLILLSLITLYVANAFVRRTGR